MGHRNGGAHNKGKGAGIKFLRDHVGYQDPKCLTWPLAREWQGYGILGHDGRRFKAHRYMCELAHGKPPTPKHEAAHSCGNGHLGCVNPRHLSWKTRAENQQDRSRHGRSNIQGRARKLTYAQALQVRAEQGKTPVCYLADRYGVSRGVIRKIHLGETYLDPRPQYEPAH